MGRDDHRPFDGMSELSELARLARYRPAGPAGDTAPDLAVVQRGDLVDAPRIYVFVHGWQPGSRATADLVYATEGEVVHAWDERVENTAGLTMVQQYLPLLHALAERDPESAVLWFSWVDQSATDLGLFAARDSLKNTEANGRRLAIALARAIGDGVPDIHLIGHSHGCVVAAHAANSLSDSPAHVTLLDCPENWFSRAGGAAGLLHDVLVRLQPGRGEGRPFVDSYATVFGASYRDSPGLSEVVDVRLAPARNAEQGLTPVSAGHQFPVAWYAGTVAAPELNAGFNWSPLRGTDTSVLGSAYVGGQTGRLREVARRGQEGARTLNRVFETLEVPPLTLTRTDPDVLVSLVLPDDAVAVEFDYRLRRFGRGSRLLGAVDRRLAFTAAGDVPVPEHGRYMRVSGGAGRETHIQFRLEDPGLLSSAVITSIRLVRDPRPARNYSDGEVSRLFIVAGAAGGVVGTLAFLGAAKAVRAGARRLFVQQ